MLPFALDDDPADREAGIISIEAYGYIFGAQRYCYATYELKHPYMYNAGDYDEMVNLLEDSEGETVKVIFRMKKGVPTEFEIDLDSLAAVYGDTRFRELFLLGWSINDKSFKELR